MFSVSHSVNLDDGCNSIHITKELVSISNSKTLNVFKKDELFEGTSGAPIYAINHDNDVVKAKFNNKGNYLGIFDFDHILTVYDVEKECNVVYKTDSLSCKNIH